MAQYFFKMSQAEKNDILDKHRTVYDGYVTEYAQGSNQQPLYVQDFANDKEGITVSNKGVVNLILIWVLTKILIEEIELVMVQMT